MRRREGRGRERLGVGPVESGLCGGDQVAVQPEHRLASGLQMKVRGSVLDRQFQQIVDVHGPSPPCVGDQPVAFTAARPEGGAAGSFG